MFCIRIAGLPIGMDNQYSYVRWLCRDYLTEEAPLFTVRATREELLRQQNADPRFPLPYRESLCLYRALCLQLPRYDAFLMHSAVVAVDGAAYVFAAPSGVGKSTHIRLWLDHFGEKAQVINGDKPVFRFLDGVLQACGTPWRGKEELGVNRICPVAGICFLEQAPENRIRRLQAAEVTERIFHQLLLPRDPGDFDRFWALLDRTLADIPFYLLQCTPTPEAMQLSYETMRRKES